MSLPISAILKDLEDVPKSIIPILASLHRDSARLSQISKVDVKHLTSRTLNLCKSNKPYQVWCGVNVINVLIENSDILASYGSQFFSQLLKVLQTHKSNRKVLYNAVECLNKLCGKIRGKPTLTREVLTPNLTALMTLYLDNLSDEPELMSTSLQVLVLNHPTTSRPFANKIRAKILTIIAADTFLSYPDSVRLAVTSTLATLPIVEKDGPDQYWLKDVNRILNNIGGTVRIFESLLDLKEDADTSKLLQRFNSEDEEIFGTLSIDVNHPESFLSISSRIQLLLAILHAYVTTATQYTISVPIGKIVGIAELISSVNTKFISFKREIRDVEIKEMTKLVLIRSHHATVKFLGSLPMKYSGTILPHMTSIILFLEQIIFLDGKRLDRSKILEEEDFMCDLLNCVAAYLHLVNHFHDHSLFIRYIELAIFLIESREVVSAQPKENIKQTQHSKAARKRAKKNNSTSLADVLSHEHLFVQAVPKSTKRCVFEFFNTVIPRVTIAPTQYNKLIKAVLVESVKYKDQLINETVPQELKNILTALILTPAPDSASILPIASTLLWDSPLVSVFVNPRFPQLPVIAKNIDVEQDVEEDDDEEAKEVEVEEFVVSDEPQSKKRRLDEESETASVESLPTTSKPGSIVQDHIFSRNSVRETFDEALNQSAITTEASVLQQNEMQEQPDAQGETQPAAIEDESMDDDGSEIEIPDLDLEDDSDEN